MFIRVSNNHAVLLLESDEGVDWSDEFFPFLVLELNDFFFDLAGLIVTIKHDMSTARLQKIDHLCIIECKNDVGDQNLFNVNAAMLWYEFLVFLFSRLFSCLVLSLKCLQLISQNAL